MSYITESGPRFQQVENELVSSFINGDSYSQEPLNRTATRALDIMADYDLPRRLSLAILLAKRAHVTFHALCIDAKGNQ